MMGARTVPGDLAWSGLRSVSGFVRKSERRMTMPWEMKRLVLAASMTARMSESAQIYSNSFIGSPLSSPAWPLQGGMT
jgi:hypothetical protein